MDIFLTPIHHPYIDMNNRRDSRRRYTIYSIYLSGNLLYSVGGDGFIRIWKNRLQIYEKQISKSHLLFICGEGKKIFCADNKTVYELQVVHEESTVVEMKDLSALVRDKEEGENAHKKIKNNFTTEEIPIKKIKKNNALKLKSVRNFSPFSLDITTCIMKKNYLIIGSLDGHLNVYYNGRLFLSLKYEKIVGCSIAKNTLLIQTDEKIIFYNLIERREFKEQLIIERNIIYEYYFSRHSWTPDYQYVAVGMAVMDMEYVVVVFSNNGREQCKFVGHNAAIECVSFCPIIFYAEKKEAENFCAEKNTKEKLCAEKKEIPREEKNYAHEIAADNTHKSKIINFRDESLRNDKNRVRKVEETILKTENKKNPSQSSIFLHNLRKNLVHKLESGAIDLKNIKEQSQKFTKNMKLATEKLPVIEKKEEECTQKKIYLCAVASQDRSISLWLSNKNRPICVLKNCSRLPLIDLKWSACGSIIYAVSFDGTIIEIRLNKEFFKFSKRVVDDLKKDIPIEQSGSAIYDNRTILHKNHALHKNNIISSEPHKFKKKEFSVEQNNNFISCKINGTELYSYNYPYEIKHMTYNNKYLIIADSEISIYKISSFFLKDILYIKDISGLKIFDNLLLIERKNKILLYDIFSQRERKIKTKYEKIEYKNTYFRIINGNAVKYYSIMRHRLVEKPRLENDLQLVIYYERLFYFYYIIDRRKKCLNIYHHMKSICTTGISKEKVRWMEMMIKK